MEGELFNLSGKTAIITGGGNGIGKACGRLLAEYGASIAVADLNAEDGDRTAYEINHLIKEQRIHQVQTVHAQHNQRAVAFSCDVTNDSALTELVKGTLREFGKINILVNCAGAGGGGKENPFEITPDYLEKIYKLNVFSAWRLSQLCVPHMARDGYGSIVNISSMSSVDRAPGMHVYASSKAALNHLVANLAYDFGPLGVRINNVGPGATRTHALHSVLNKETEEKMLRHTPLKRLGTPLDIAGAVLYFAAPVSEWVSGQTLFVNGGGDQMLE